MARLISCSTNPSHRQRDASVPLCCRFSCELFLVPWNQIYRQSAFANRLGSKVVFGNQLCVPANTFSWSSDVTNGSVPRAASNAHLLHSYRTVEITGLGLNSSCLELPQCQRTRNDSSRLSAQSRGRVRRQEAALAPNHPWSYKQLRSWGGWNFGVKRDGSPWRWWA